ncbi:MAG: GNAT family N-acetyltransferase [Patescibacteria group bacterium]
MPKISLRKLKTSDEKYFSQWWRNKELLKLTSGVFKRLSDQEVKKYFLAMLGNKNDHHFIIALNKKMIGHISLAKRKNSWFETQIIIGEKKYWGKGYGTKAIQSVIKKATVLGITKIYFEVRPDNARAIRSYKKSGFKKLVIKKYPENRNLPKTLKMVLEIK